MVKKILPATILFLFIFCCRAALPQAHELNGHIELEGRLFFHEPLYPEQQRHNGSIAFTPEYYHEWRNGLSFVFTPFVRLDSSDPERTHLDIREMNLLLLGDPWELRFGLGRVFWGATEFVHLVDIVNQTDLVEDIRGEDKLGQPMVRLSVPSDWGVFDFFVLPWFRERTFPGSKGRLRLPVVIDTDNPSYESSAEENHIDFALRYSRSFSLGDLGFYYFSGTAREPLLIPSANAAGPPLQPYYQLIDQIGIDLQIVAGSWLWKLEALYQGNDVESYSAATGGFEYTFFSISDSLADLGIIVEFAFDDRGKMAQTSFEEDLLLGLRLALNDPQGSELLLGFSYDLDNSGNVLQLEAGRRLTDNVKIFLEGWTFFNTDPNDLNLYSIRDDDFVRLRIFYYF